MPETLSGPSPPFFIRVFAQVATGLYYLESVGAMVVLWLCPSLTPEPRIHQFISTSPVHHRHHHHHHRVSHRSETILSQSDPSPSTLSEESAYPTIEDLERVDQALKKQQRWERLSSDSASQVFRWRDGQRTVEEEDSVLEWKERPPLGVSAL